MGKHVIFLGAGASVTSGYPDAIKLRLLMSSRPDLRSYTAGLLNRDLENPVVDDFLEAIPEQFHETIRFFREGGFASVDEFCRLCRGGHFEEHIPQLKQFLTFVLALNNPELKFENSDYYRFVQKLFIAGSHRLRDDVAILSFNYDPYLEFLLIRALERRESVALGSAHQSDVSALNAISSGLFQPSDLNWLNRNGLAVLKLHGSMVYPERGRNANGSLFKGNLDARKDAVRSTYMAHAPPILFPWEVFEPDGEFARDKSKFAVQQTPDFTTRAQVYEVFRAVWNKAAELVASASKISFVGLSMHNYLEPGFRFLFNMRNENSFSLVVANRDNKRFARADKFVHPSSPCGKVGALLTKILGKDVKFRPSESENAGMLDVADFEGKEGITQRDDFADFIEHEL